MQVLENVYFTPGKMLMLSLNFKHAHYITTVQLTTRPKFDLL